MSVLIRDAALVFSDQRRRRTTTSVIVLHHTGESVLQSVETIHDYYLHRVDKNGATYIGIAYHYYIRKDGSIWRGREEWAIGGHAGVVANPISIAICFEGDYEHEAMMSEAQLKAGIALVSDIKSRYGGLTVKRHLYYCDTDCPGKNFPFDAVAFGNSAAALAQPAKAGTHSEMVKGSGTTFYVRQSPSVASPDIGVVRGGQCYITELLASGWRKISFNKKTGYVGPAAW